MLQMLQIEVAVVWVPSTHSVAIFTRGQFWPSGIVVACVCLCVHPSMCAVITCLSARWLITCSRGVDWPSRSNLTSKSKVTLFCACRHDNSSPVQARITKFGPKVQNTWVKILIVSEGSGDVMVLCRSRPPPAARNGFNAITQKPLDGLFSNLVYTLVVIVSWPD